MTLGTTLPFGLRDVKIKPFAAGSETPGTAVDLPNAQTFTFSETGDNQELRGDDGVVAIHDLGAGLDWELEAGGISFEAVVAMYGGSIISSGVTPNQIKTFTKLDTDTRPYFQLEGQAISDSGGDMHGIVYKAKATGDLTGAMKDGNFWITGAKGRGIGRTSDRKLYAFVENESATAIV